MDASGSRSGSRPLLLRRDILRLGLGLGLSGVAAGARSGNALAADQPAGFFAQRHLPIGLQLYTLGDAVKRDLDGTLARAARIGYRALELAGYHGHAPTTLLAAKRRHEVKFTSIHVPARAQANGPGLDGDLPRLATELHTLGVTDVVMPMFPIPERLGNARDGEAPLAWLARIAPQLTADDWKRTAALLNEKGTALKREGLRFGYHNHNPEFAPVAGTTGLDLLLQETSSDTVVFELDVGWVAAAGEDPVALLRRHGRRFQLLHVKDIRASTRANFTLQQDPAEVGSGRLDWLRLLPAAHAAGVRKFYVEQEPPFSGDRFAAIEKSYRFLAALDTGLRSV
jgi:sugar phosphate isomerase/epimerase